MANLTLVKTITQRDLTSIESLTRYVAANLRGALKEAIFSDSVIKMHWDDRKRAEAQGTLNQLLGVASLDKQMLRFDTGKVEEPSATPIMPTTPAPERNPELRAQIETYLSYLCPRAQAILRLRYGLDDDNEREHTTIEIAHILGLDYSTVGLTERDAIKRLHALASGEATIGKYKGRLCIILPRGNNDREILPEQETALRNVYTERQQQVFSISGRALAKATGIPEKRVYTFLHTSHPEKSEEGRAQHQRQRLEEAYKRLSAQGKPFGYITLAREAHTARHAAREFLLAREAQTGKPTARRFLHTSHMSKEERAQYQQQRLEEAYQRLSTQGKSFACETLAREAHVRESVASRFLKEREGKTSAPA